MKEQVYATEKGSIEGKYDVADRIGLGKRTEHGIFRPIDIFGGNIVFQGVNWVELRRRRETRLQEQAINRLIKTFDDYKPRRGRPRKGVQF